MSKYDSFENCVIKTIKTDDKKRNTAESNDENVFVKNKILEIPLHFGFITKESENFENGTGIVDISFHSVYKITGKDRYEWLTKITSQTFVKHSEDYSKEALILNPQGHVIFAINVLVLKDYMLVMPQELLPNINENIETISKTGTQNNITNFEKYFEKKPAENKREVHDVAKKNILDGFFAETNLGNFLKKMIFMADICIENISETLETICVMGDLNADYIEKIKIELSENNLKMLGVYTDPWPNMGAKNVTYYNVEENRKLFENLQIEDYTKVENSIKDITHPATGKKLNIIFVQNEIMSNFGDNNKSAFEILCKKYAPCGIYAFVASNIIRYRPWGVCAQKLLPHEVDWLRTAVQINKGCYCGQETVARIVNIGKPPRRLVKLYLDGMDALEDLDSNIYVIKNDEKIKIGEILFMGVHHDEGLIALGLIKRNFHFDNSHVTNNSAKSFIEKTDLLLNDKICVGNVAATIEDIVNIYGESTASIDSERIKIIRKNRLR